MMFSSVIEILQHLLLVNYARMDEWMNEWMNVDNNLVSYFSTLSRPRIAFNILIGFYPYVRGHLAWLVITNSYCMSFEKKMQ